MPPVIHRFDPPDRFVVGTVGEPGQRTFFLQARAGRRLTSVALEKEQVQILAERVDELLDEVLESGQAATLVPSLAPGDLVDADPLEQPIEQEFRAGTITLSWDTHDDRVVIEVFPVADSLPGAPAVDDLPLEADEAELLELPLAEPEPAEVFLVRMPPAMARAFAARASGVVSAGRPQCQFCGRPMDPAGHLCPRANGYLRSGA